MSKTHRFFALLSIVLVAVASIAFAQNAERIEVVIELREFNFTVADGEANAPIVFQAGQPYSVVFANLGMMEHEVLIGHTVLVEDGVPDGCATNLLDARWRDGEFTYPSRFINDSTASTLPARHFTAGAPRTLSLSLELRPESSR